MASHQSPDLPSYDTVIVAFSGGKDSIACLLTLLERGVPPAHIELVHHKVDGGADGFMDWPCTTAYCQAIASALHVPLFLSSKEGGFLREMLRDDVPTAPIQFQTPGGTVARIGGAGPRNTRLAYPQVSPDLRVRWCSAYLKIDCMAALIRNQDRFLGRRTLIVTGERAQESAARAHYAVFEPDRSDTRAGTRRPRHVDHWRPVHGLSERDVWEMLRRHGIAPAPAYRLGWSRLSCLGCIFGSADQWASVRHIAPDRFARIAAYERQFQRTIRRELCVEALADRGRPFPALVAQPRLAKLAMRDAWTDPVIVPPRNGSCRRARSGAARDRPDVEPHGPDIPPSRVGLTPAHRPSCSQPSWRFRCDIRTQRRRTPSARTRSSSPTAWAWTAPRC